jgi:hypothetical protein
MWDRAEVLRADVYPLRPLVSRFASMMAAD